MQTSIPWNEYEITDPFQREKTDQALDQAANLIDTCTENNVKQTTQVTNCRQHTLKKALLPRVWKITPHTWNERTIWK
jgi:hypothetical protein